jgi:hypothetical protein
LLSDQSAPRRAADPLRGRPYACLGAPKPPGASSGPMFLNATWRRSSPSFYFLGKGEKMHYFLKQRNTKIVAFIFLLWYKIIKVCSTRHAKRGLSCGIQ